MATVAELLVRIGADITDFSTKMKATNSDFAAMTAASRAAEAAMRGNFAALASGAAQFQGNTAQFMEALRMLGAQQKAVSDAMLVNNERARVSFLQNIGTILAMSTQTSKLQESLRATGEPLRQLDVLTLGLANRLELLARSGTPAVLALKQLGPTASMKQLQDQISVINTGFGRMQAVALVSGVATVAIFASLGAAAVKAEPQIGKVFATIKTNIATTFQPLINVVAQVILSIGQMLERVTAITAAFAKAHPQITAVVTGFLALIPAVTLLLSPLAIGIKFWDNYRAAFFLVFQMIRPFVIGFSSIAGTVVVVTAAIVGIIAIFVKMFQTSEQLRNTIVNAWTAIKATILGALAPIQPAFQQLVTAFHNMIAAFTGGKGMSQEVFRAMGDALAGFIRPAVDFFLPLLKGAFQTLSTVLVSIIQGMIIVFNGITAWWKTNGPAISSAAQVAFGVVRQAIQTATSFIQSIWPQVSQIVTQGMQLIGTIAKAVFPVVGTIIKTVFQAVMAITKAVWPFVKFLIIDTWESIKRGIQGALNIIQGVIRAFSAAFRGDWSGLWAAVKQIFSGAWDLLVAAFNLFLFGKIFKIAKLFGGTLSKFFSSTWNSIKGIWDDVLTRIFVFVDDTFKRVKSNITGAMNSIRAFIQSIWNNIFAFLKGIWTMVQSAATSIFNSIAGFLSKLWGAVFNRVSQAWTNIMNLFRQRFTAIQIAATSIFNAIAGFMSRLWGTMFNRVSQAWTNISNLFRQRFTAIQNTATSIFNRVASFLSGLWGQIFNRASAAWSNIMNMLGGRFRSIFNTGVNIFNTMVNRIIGAFNTLRGSISSALDAVISAVKSRLNSIIGSMNRMIGGFNKLPGPGIPTIPKLARGGIVTRPTLAMIGERGPEAVIPLDQMNEGRAVIINQTFNTMVRPEDIQIVVQRELRKFALQFNLRT